MGGIGPVQIQQFKAQCQSAALFLQNGAKFEELLGEAIEPNTDWIAEIAAVRYHGQKNDLGLGEGEHPRSPGNDRGRGRGRGVRSPGRSRGKGGYQPRGRGFHPHGSNPASPNNNNKAM